MFFRVKTRPENAVGLVGTEVGALFRIIALPWNTCTSTHKESVSVKKGIFLLLPAVLFLMVTQAFPATGGIDAAFKIVVNDVLTGDTTGKRVYGSNRMTSPGMVVKSWHESVTLPAVQGFLFFVDDEPEANW